MTQSLCFFGSRLTIVADHTTTGGQYDLIEGYFPPGSQTPPHRHTPYWEQLYISPGVVPTPGYNLLGLNDQQVQEFVDSQAVTIPLRRVGTPDEIAKAVVFLACDDSSFVNGIELFQDLRNVLI